MCHRLAILTLCLIGAFASESAWANRYYSPETGRFISRDTPLETEGMLALYEYTSSRPNFYSDPSGWIPELPEDPPRGHPCYGAFHQHRLFDCGYTCKVCGPDVTAWFANELKGWKALANQVRESIIPLGWTPWMAKVGMKIQYKSMNFNSLYCPESKECKDTVWICGKCIHKSELGNIVLGFLARSIGVPEDWVMGGSNAIGNLKPGEGPDSPAETGAIGVGMHTGNQLVKKRMALSPATICQFLMDPVPFRVKDTFKNRKLWNAGFVNPWGEMTGKYKNCEKCPDPPWSGPPHKMGGVKIGNWPKVP